jgi:hypothetical protein
MGLLRQPLWRNFSNLLFHNRCKLLDRHSVAHRHFTHGSLTSASTSVHQRLLPTILIE